MIGRMMDLVTWLFARLAPKAEREALIGDLAEGYSQRANSASSRAAEKWWLRQIFASMPPLLYVRFARAVWLRTLGVSLLAYVGVGMAQLIILWLIPSSSSPVYSPLGLVVIFPTVVVIGYCAERFRRRAAIVLGAMMLLAMTAMTLWGNESMPLWYVVAYFIVGPSAAFIGSGLHSLSLTREETNRRDRVD